MAIKAPKSHNLNRACLRFGANNPDALDSGDIILDRATKQSSLRFADASHAQPYK
jgi:hypothetical protein